MCFTSTAGKCSTGHRTATEVVKVVTVHVEPSCDLPLEVTTAIFVDLFCLPGSTNGSIHSASKHRRYISSLLM